MENLGIELARLRKATGLTLRRVEAATGVSNAYLSQLETGKIKTPSPNTLFKLSQLFGGSYEDLMEKAGYPVPQSQARQIPETVSRLAARVGEVSSSEAEALEDYLKFLRQRGSK